LRIYCDTSVLVAAVISGHPHHAQASELLAKIQARKLEAVISAHCTAEFYAVLTRLPLSPPIYPLEAWRLLTENIVPYIEVRSIGPADYSAVLRQAGEKGWSGGLIYDALHLKTATKNHCERIYTFNLRHFLQIAPGLEDVICSP
jgi:predicted nucleic acid-binding protein